MTKLIIKTMDANFALVARGKTSINEDASDYELVEKIKKAAARAGKKCVSVVVETRTGDVRGEYDTDGNLLKADEAPAPKKMPVGVTFASKRKLSPSGVIADIFNHLAEGNPDNEDGWTAQELAKKLAKKHKRPESGVLITVRCQITRTEDPVEKTKDGRSTRYKMNG